jgi:hypothetical protein
MKYLDVLQETQPAMSRRGLMAMLPAGIAGCLGCLRASACPQQGATAGTGRSWTDKTDLTWEQLFRFAYQKDLIPLLQALAGKVGREEFIRMVREAGDAVVHKKTAGRPPVFRDLAAFAANLRNPPPLLQHALEAEIVEDTRQALAYRVTKCLWAKSFLDENAGDIGYAMVCYPDYAVARSLHPKLKLEREKTLMQGHDCCVLRYVMEA